MKYKLFTTIIASAIALVCVTLLVTAIHADMEMNHAWDLHNQYCINAEQHFIDTNNSGCILDMIH